MVVFLHLSDCLSWQSINFGAMKGQRPWSYPIYVSMLFLLSSIYFSFKNEVRYVWQAMQQVY
jgi:hypothetical protein